MTDHEEKILQKYMALEGWVKRARDMAILGNVIKHREALNMVEICLCECEELDD